MNPIIEIKSFHLFENDDGRAPYEFLAVAEIDLPQLHVGFSHVRLVRYRDHRGYVAMPPNAKNQHSKTYAVAWANSGPLAQAIVAKLREAHLEAVHVGKNDAE